jgi:ATP-dependent RNA helicase DeaD
MIETIDAPVDTGFAALGLTPRLVEALTAMGYDEPTPIQAEAIPPLLEGRDLIGMAATGTGKTAAFALPLVQRLGSGMARGDKSGPAAIVLVPTRELAMQVAEAIEGYGRSNGISVLPVYGGQAFDGQLRGLKRGVDVVVATPGRALDHMRRETLKLGNVSVVILDEADEMFAMGFAEDIEAILTATPSTRQTMLFSATMPPHIAAVGRRHLTDPVEVRVARAVDAPGEAPRVRQSVYMVQRAFKLAALGRILDMEAPASALVFCRTRSEVDELTEAMAARGYRPEALHGGMSQEQRDRVMRLFRAGTATLVIATDVAARGLDVDGLSHVINYNLPPEMGSYVHRIGRVGRAGREGVAITIADPRDHRQLQNIARFTGQRIESAQVPTLADLKARRLERTSETLRAAIAAGDLEPYRAVLEKLSAEFAPAEVALAAIKLLHTANAPADGDRDDIPEQALAPIRVRERFVEERNDGPRRGPTPFRAPGRGMARIFIGVGRDAGVTPRDLVGAIANEAGINGREIGGIEILERFSLVEVPEPLARQVVEALRPARIKGRKAVVRRDRRWGE